MKLVRDAPALLKTVLKAALKSSPKCSPRSSALLCLLAAPAGSSSWQQQEACVVLGDVRRLRPGTSP